MPRRPQMPEVNPDLIDRLPERADGVLFPAVTQDNQPVYVLLLKPGRPRVASTAAHGQCCHGGGVWVAIGILLLLLVVGVILFGMARSQSDPMPPEWGEEYEEDWGSDENADPDWGEEYEEPYPDDDFAPDDDDHEDAPDDRPYDEGDGE